MTIDDQIRERLHDVVDPCAAATGSNLDIVEMGLVESIDVDDGHVQVDMRLTSPVCYQVPYFVEEIEERVQPLPAVESVTVETDDGMEWTPEMISDEGQARREAVLDGYAARGSREEATTD